MAEPLNRIPRVQILSEGNKSHRSLQWASYTILILDLAFLAWGVIRLILIAVPRLQIDVVGIIFNAMAFTREEYLDLIFDALRKLFLLPDISRFTLPDVLLNGFMTALCFVIGYVLYKVVQKRLSE